MSMYRQPVRCISVSTVECVHSAGYKVEHTLTAHSGGLEALDARGNFVATCGYGMRLGQVALDNMVKVHLFHPAAALSSHKVDQVV